MLHTEDRLFLHKVYIVSDLKTTIKEAPDTRLRNSSRQVEEITEDIITEF
jgi:hypothetical protein